MLMPLYGMLLYSAVAPTLHPMLSHMHIGMYLSGTIVLTLLIPMFLLVILWRIGYIDSMHLHRAEQRTAPYIYTIICYGFWGYFLRFSMKMPTFMFLIAIGAIIALLGITIINYWWKISAHLTGIGGLLGGVCSFALNYSTAPFILLAIILGLSMLLMYARLYINAHTPMQVISGFLLGLLSCFIPTFIMTYA